jgi:hypothetical protein
MAKYAKMLPVAVLALKKSAQAMLLLFLGLPIALVITASAVFFAEQTVSTFDKDAHVWLRDDGSTSPFQSVPNTFWFTIVTMTTTGYGDHVPQSPTGKAVTVVGMFIGLIVLTFPLSIFSSNFLIALREYKQEQDKKRIEELSDVEKMKKVDLYDNIKQLLSMREDIRQKLDSAVELVKVAQEEQADVDRILDNLQKYMKQHKLL